MTGEDSLLRDNTIVVDEKKSRESELYNYIIQRPNSYIFGVPVALAIYNLGNPNFEQSLSEWSVNHPKKYEFFKNVFSEKQTQLVFNTEKGFNDWFLKKGRPPEIYNSLKAERSAQSLKSYFFTQGYFDADVTFLEDYSKEKQVSVEYQVTKNERYKIDTLLTEIASPILDSIYKLNIKGSLVKQGNPFLFNSFEEEKERLDKLFKNSGIYRFNASTIGYYSDSLNEPKNKKVVLKIPERIVSEGDSVFIKPYKIQKYNKVNVYVDFDKNANKNQAKDSVFLANVGYFSPNKLQYKPHRLDDAFFLYPDSIFRTDDINFTLSNLRKLQNFRPAIGVSITENEDESLDADVYLQSLKKYALKFDLDATTSNTKPFGILGKFSFLDRNIFHGLELFELSFQGSFLNVSYDPTNSSRFFNAWEFITKASLTIPRIFFPFNTENIISKEMSPVTVFDLSAGTQKNIGLDRLTATAGLSYAWRGNKNLGHKLDLYNFQLIKNQNIENYFQVYNSEYEKVNLVHLDIKGTELNNNYDDINLFIDEILDPGNGYEQTNPGDFNIISDVEERKIILTENVLVPTISYAINYNTKEDLSDKDFYFLSARVVASGNVTTAISYKSNEYGQKLMFGLPIAQYFKTEFEFKRYWNTYGSNVFVARFLVGAAIPYGNSISVPFSRSYTAGGSNDNRAWQTYDLGPGGELNFLEYNVGTFKIATNFEYRFKLLDKIYSALFVDAGNIWDITNSNLTREEGKFTGFSSLKYTAIGSGAGIRYDFGFLIFRFDVGFKTYEPYLPNEKRWFTNYNFGNAVYNIGINYPF